MNIQTVNFKETSFVSVTNPETLEEKYLKNNFGFNQLHLDDYINKTQIAKIESFRDYTLVVLDFPFFSSSGYPPAREEDKPKSILRGKLLNIPSKPLSSVSFPQFMPSEKKRRIFSNQVDFFIGKDYLVVIHDGLLQPINHIFSECQKTLRNREEYMGEGSVFLAYRIIDALVDSCFPAINEITSIIDKIDKQLEGKQSENTIEDISTTRRNIVVFHTIIKPILQLLQQLEEGVYKQLNGKMQPFWGNISDHIQKIMERIEDSRELIEGISESNESLLSYRNNELVKFFTIITSVSFPFIIVNNLYSMNVVGLPYAQYPWIVWILFGIIFVAGVIIIVYFKIRKWI